MKIIISRTDNLGDVLLTLPLAGFLKRENPSIIIYFIGKSYTRPLIECSGAIDFFLDRESLLQNPAQLKAIRADAILFVFPDKAIAKIAKEAKIPIRIGTSHRWWHWLYANRLHNFSRRNTDLHEAQLNFKLLQPLGYDIIPSLNNIADWYALTPPILSESLKRTLLPNQKHVILHPKSKGSAREWHLDKFYQLIAQNPTYQFFITGIQEESEAIQAQKPALFDLPNVTNLAGKLSLKELIAFIAAADALVAASTGPLHIAAALGIKAIGIFPPMKPIHPTRWQPIGKQAHTLVLNKDCNACRKKLPCYCMEAIKVQDVEALLSI